MHFVTMKFMIVALKDIDAGQRPATSVLNSIQQPGQSSEARMLRRLCFSYAFLAALMARPVAANAYVFDWSYTGNNNGPVSASGTLDATPLGGGIYAVTSITGARNGVAITGIANYAAQDNYVYTSVADLDGVDAHVDYLGLAYSITGGSNFNVYYDTITTDDYECGAVGYCEIGPGVTGASGLGPPVDSIGAMTSFTLSAVPEASTWAMMLIGLAGLGLVGYRRRKHGSAAVGAV